MVDTNLEDEKITNLDDGLSFDWSKKDFNFI